MPGALQRIWNEMVEPLGEYAHYEDLLLAYILTLNCVGFVAPDGSMFGTLCLFDEQPTLHANFAAHWMRLELGMESLLEEHI